MKGAKAKIGEGIYTAADAARILDIPYPKANYWFKHYARQKLSDSVDYVYHFEVNNLIAVNFLTLLEMNIFYKLKESGLKTNDIITIHKSMSKWFSTPYPFAHQRLYLVRDSSIKKRPKRREHLLFGDSSLLLHLDKGLQAVFPDILLPLCDKIMFDDDQMAKRYYPLGRDKSVVVDPQHQFGQPIIEGTNVLTETLVSYFKGGETIEFIASIFSIETKKVKDAVLFAKAA